MRLQNKIPIRIPVVLLAILVIVGCMLNAGTTLAWFAYSDGLAVELTAGKVSYRPNSTENAGDSTDYGAFIPNTMEEDENSYIYPGRQLVEDGRPLKLKNLSSIKTDVRVRITGLIREPDAAEDTGESLNVRMTPDGNFQLGLKDEESSLFIPLLNLTFGSGDTYYWKVETPLEEGAAEWGLAFPSGEAVPPAPAGGSLFDVLTSVTVIPELSTVSEELIFTKLYSGKRLTLTAEYLAKQHDEMEWTLFYKDVFNE